METSRNTKLVIDTLLNRKIKGFLKHIANMMEKVHSRSKLLFILIVALAVFLRYYQFPSLPGGLHPEEASAGYESYALLLHGTDQWGNRWPVYFPAWGSGQSVLLSYLNIPFIKVFGLTVLGQRFLSALLGIVTMVIFYAFIKKWHGTRIALLASVLLATDPWHIMASRWSLESNLLPCFLLLGIACLSYCYTSKYARLLIPFSLVFLALALYTYAVSIIIIPIFLVLYFGLVGRGTLWRNRRGVLGSFVIFLLIASPFFLFLLDNYILHTTPWIVQHLPLTIPLLLKSRLAEITAGQNTLAANVHFLMSGFNDGQIVNMADGYSPFGLLSLPLMVIGIAYSIRRRQGHANLFLIWLVATIPLFFLFPLNIVRANALYLPFIALGAIGMSDLYDSVDKKDTKLAVLSIVLIALIIYNGLFCIYYFNNYNNDSKDTFNTGFDIALQHARSAATADEPIYVSNWIQLNYAYTLFFLKADPIDFQKHVSVVVSHGTYRVVQYRNYYFDLGETERTSAIAFMAILKSNEQIDCRARIVFYSTDDWTVEQCFNGHFS